MLFFLGLWASKIYYRFFEKNKEADRMGIVALKFDDRFLYHIAKPKTDTKHAGFLPEERAWMDSFIDAGYVDTFRHFCKEPGMYSWWSYRFHAREKNVGWRLDYECVNSGFVDKLVSASILKDVMGSDHCPVELVTE